jgi:import receptor subunit TOM20
MYLFTTPKPEPTARPENIEKTRTPYGTARQIGSALYTVSSYLNHSCAPLARPSFASGTAELHLIANQDIKRGDVLTVAFVDVTQHTDESPVECRRRRRVELARGWRFACGCGRCKEEEKTMSVEEQGTDADVQDGSKVEASMRHFEEGAESYDVE